jgi:small subunit ribosomal protein S1
MTEQFDNEIREAEPEAAAAPEGAAGETQVSPEAAEPQATMSQDEMEAALSPLTKGQIVEGLIVQIDEQGALVDVGTKSEGHIPANEMGITTTEDGRPLAVGDRVSVFVVRPEDDEGNPVLSKRMADYESTWHRLTKAFEGGEVIGAMVTDRVKGGLVVDLGVRGFLPASHVRIRNVHALDRLVGQSIKVKIIEVDRARKRVVVSHKDAVDEERLKRRDQTIATLQENQICKGVVRRITDYGAFVDLGGVDGLLHVTEMAWTRIDHPSEVLKVGDKIDVMVLRFDREQNRISLGRKQILPDPWEEARDRFKVGQVVTGTVSRVVPFGAFVKLETGIEGIIPNSELPGGRNAKAQDLLSVGDKVETKVVNVRSGERRMTLSLRQMQQQEERRELREYMDRQADESRVTIGDLFGSMFTEAAANRAAPEEEVDPVAELMEAEELIEVVEEVPAPEVEEPVAEAAVEAPASEPVVEVTPEPAPAEGETSETEPVEDSEAS